MKGFSSQIVHDHKNLQTLKILVDLEETTVQIQELENDQMPLKTQFETNMKIQRDIKEFIKSLEKLFLSFHIESISRLRFSFDFDPNLNINCKGYLETIKDYLQSYLSGIFDSFFNLFEFNNGNQSIQLILQYFSSDFTNEINGLQQVLALLILKHIKELQFNFKAIKSEEGLKNEQYWNYNEEDCVLEFNAYMCSGQNMLYTIELNQTKYMIQSVLMTQEFHFIQNKLKKIEMPKDDPQPDQFRYPNTDLQNYVEDLQVDVQFENEALNSYFMERKFRKSESDEKLLDILHRFGSEFLYCLGLMNYQIQIFRHWNALIGLKFDSFKIKINEGIDPYSQNYSLKYSQASFELGIYLNQMENFSIIPDLDHYFDYYNKTIQRAQASLVNISVANPQLIVGMKQNIPLSVNFKFVPEEQRNTQQEEELFDQNSLKLILFSLTSGKLVELGITSSSFKKMASDGNLVIEASELPFSNEKIGMVLKSRNLYLGSNFLFCQTDNDTSNILLNGVFALKNQSPKLIIGQELSLIIDTSFKTFAKNLHQDISFEIKNNKARRFIFKNKFESEENNQTGKEIIKSRWITRNLMMVTLKSYKQQNLSIGQPQYLGPLEYLLNLEPITVQELTVEFLSDKKVDLQRTQLTSLLLQSKKIDYHKQENSERDQLKDQFFLKYAETKIELKIDQNSILINSELDLPKIQAIQTFNTLSSLTNNHQNLYTRAGEKRTEILRFHDQNDNVIDLEPDFVKSLKILFVHTVFPQLIYPGQAIIHSSNQAQQELLVDWNPFTKGVFRLFINEVQIKTDSSIVVLAGNIDKKKTVHEVSNNKSVAFHDKMWISFLYKDKYNNSIGEIEKKLYYQNQELFKINLQRSSPETKLTIFPGNLEKNGQQKVEFSVIVNSINNANNKDSVSISFEIAQNEQTFMLVKQIDLEVNGISMEERKKHFYVELNKRISQQSEETIKIHRNNFAEDILEKFENFNMKKNLYVQFADENGIDCGGLKKEFYEMVGSVMKDNRYKFFQLTLSNDVYFIHEEIKRIKDRKKYMKIFGKFVAHTILKQEILGITVATAFIKVLFGLDTEFDDLQSILSEDEFRNYEFLRNCTEDQLKQVDQNFVYQQGQKIHELVENGSNKAVNIQNRVEFLNKVAEFLLKTQYEEIYTAFREGFDSVFELSLLKQWFLPNEVCFLTCGLKEINYDFLSKVIHYSGGTSIIVTYFKRYLQEAKLNILKGFLKFTTGSSNLPIDTNGFKISVEFKKNEKINKLPLSHTCFKIIEVPIYPSYEILQNKLDIAFTFGAEGFGFA